MAYLSLVFWLKITTSKQKSAQRPYVWPATFFDEHLWLRVHAQLYVLYSSWSSPRRLMETCQKECQQRRLEKIGPVRSCFRRNRTPTKVVISFLFRNGRSPVWVTWRKKKYGSPKLLTEWFHLQYYFECCACRKKCVSSKKKVKSTAPIACWNHRV